MSAPHYNALIAKQKQTGIITVRCECGNPAHKHVNGSNPCENCLRLDDIRVREYNKREKTRRERMEEENYEST